MSAVDFEEVFGFPPPTDDEVKAASGDLAFKFRNNGDPVGTMALFTVKGLETVSMQLIGEFAADYAAEQGIDPRIASDMVYAGFIGAIELIAAIRLRSGHR